MVSISKPKLAPHFLGTLTRSSPFFPGESEISIADHVFV